MSYSPTIGRFLEQDPTGYDDGMNPYEFVGGNPIAKVDPMGLAEQAATQPANPVATQPSDVTVTTPGGRQIFIKYNGQGTPTFYQTVEIRPAICSPIPPQAIDDEKTEHGGKDATQGPIGDNRSGDPTKPYGTGRDGKGNRDFTDNGANRGPIGAGGTQMRDAPDFPDPPYPVSFYGEKIFVTTVVVNGQTVRTVNWRFIRDDNAARIEVDDK